MCSIFVSTIQKEDFRILTPKMFQEFTTITFSNILLQVVMFQEILCVSQDINYALILNYTGQTCSIAMKYTRQDYTRAVWK